MRRLIGICSFLVLCAAFTAGCDEDPCAQELRDSAECDVLDSCCQKRVHHTVAAILGEPLLEDLKFKQLTALEYKQLLTQNRWARNDAADEVYSLVYYQLGLLRNPTTSLDDSTTTSLVNFIAGFYRSGSNTIFQVVNPNGERESQSSEMSVLAHEIAHAYQDKLFGLEAGYSFYGATVDSSQAYRSLIEGHAELVQALFDIRRENIRPRDADWFAWLKNRRVGFIESVEENYEPYLSDRHYLYYIGGLELVFREYAKAEYDIREVDSLFRRPPKRTSDILHAIFPSVQSCEDEPFVPSLPVTAEDLQELGLSYFDDWTLGPWDLTLIFGQFMEFQDAAELVAKWDNGLVTVLLTEDMVPVLVLDLQWCDESNTIFTRLRMHYLPDGLRGDQAALLEWRDDTMKLLLGPNQELVESLAQALGMN